jgi:hypothetical protein
MSGGCQSAGAESIILTQPSLLLPLRGLSVFAVKMLCFFLKTFTAKTQSTLRKTSQEKMPPPLFASPRALVTFA